MTLLKIIMVNFAEFFNPPCCSISIVCKSNIDTETHNHKKVEKLHFAKNVNLCVFKNIKYSNFDY